MNKIYSFGNYAKLIKLNKNLYRILVYDNAKIKSYVINSKEEFEEKSIEILLNGLDEALHQQMMEFAPKAFLWGKNATDDQIQMTVHDVFEEHIKQHAFRFYSIPTGSELKKMKKTQKTTWEYYFQYPPYTWRVLTPMGKNLNSIIQMDKKVETLVSALKSKIISIYREQLVTSLDPNADPIKVAKASDVVENRIPGTKCTLYIA